MPPNKPVSPKPSSGSSVGSASRASGRSMRPVNPVAPTGLELLFFYACPYCGRKVALLSPTQPALAECDACGKPFPILPVDAHSVHYVKLMLANGRAAVDADFT